MIVCLESGGTKLVAGSADPNTGELQHVLRRYRAPDQTALETLTDLVQMGKELTDSSREIEAVAYGFGGTVRRSDQHPGPCFHESGWENVDPRRHLESAFRAPAFIENDCNLAALGEAHFGARQTTGTLLYVTIGTGIGAGIVHDGDLLELGPLGEAEIGHIVVQENGPECPCGNRGCLETVCSGPGLTRLSQALGHSLDAKTLMARFRQHDPFAEQVAEQAAGYLGHVLGTAVNLLAPDLIVLGGGVMAGNAPFLELIAAKADRYTFPFFRGRTRFLLSTLQETAVCQGAAMHAIRRLADRKEKPTR